MSTRDKDEYTYLEWVTGIMMCVDMYCEREIIRISHDDQDERPRALIRKLKMVIDKYENQIPDEVKE